MPFEAATGHMAVQLRVFRGQGAVERRCLKGFLFLSTRLRGQCIWLKMHMGHISASESAQTVKFIGLEPWAKMGKAKLVIVMPFAADEKCDLDKMALEAGPQRCRRGVTIARGVAVDAHSRRTGW